MSETKQTSANKQSGSKKRRLADAHVATESGLIRYRDVKLDCHIGTGPHSKVYEASWNDSTVAVKVITERVPTWILQRMVAEATKLSKMESPFIVRVIGACSHGAFAKATHYIVTELAGISLRDMLRNACSGKSALTWIDRWNIAFDVVRGLAYLHTYKEYPLVMGHNLRAENVMLRYGGRAAALTDYGFAELRERYVYNEVSYKGDRDPRTDCGEDGSLKYTPREVIATDTKWNAAADVYAFGMLLYMIGVDSEPYKGMKNADIAAFVMRKDLLLIPNDVPIAWAALIRECMHQDPTQRPSVSAISERLAPLVVQAATEHSVKKPRTV